MFFHGRWAEVIGTEMIVGKDENDGSSSMRRILMIDVKVVGTTRRRLVLERVHLKKKD